MGSISNFLPLSSPAEHHPDTRENTHMPNALNIGGVKFSHTLKVYKVYTHVVYK